MGKRARNGSVIALVAIGLTLSQVSTAAALQNRFGARLTPDTQPQPAQYCDNDQESPPYTNCTWVMNEAQGRPGTGHIAPRDGTIKRVRLMSCDPGSFRIQVARQVGSRYRVVGNGPVIQYQGDPQGCGDDDDFIYTVESFPTGFSVSQGDRIAIRAQSTGTLRCGGGGDNTYQLAPPLVAGGPARTPTDDEGCLLLIEWVYQR